MADNFVQHQTEKLIAILKEEKRIRMQLLHLDLELQPAEMLQAAEAKQWQLLGELRTLKQDKIMPIMRQLAYFISQNAKAKGLLPNKGEKKAG